MLKNYPEEYSNAQAALGGVYLERVLEEDRNVYMPKAEHALREALKGVDKERHPQKYGSVLFNLAILYASADDIRTNETNRRSADQAFTEAARYITPEKFPEEYQKLEENRRRFPGTAPVTPGAVQNGIPRVTSCSQESQNNRRGIRTSIVSGGYGIHDTDTQGR